MNERIYRGLYTLEDILEIVGGNLSAVLIEYDRITVFDGEKERCFKPLPTPFRVYYVEVDEFKIEKRGLG